MIAAIVIVSVLLFALFIFAAVAGNRAQTRMVEQERARTSSAAEAAARDASLDRGDRAA